MKQVQKSTFLASVTGGYSVTDTHASVVDRHAAKTIITIILI